jgi:YbdK family carboxylate-amine ligase
MRSAVHSRLVAVGVEEEFHIVDLATRRLTGQADRLMGRLPAGRFSWEMQRSVVEANSRPWAGLAELAGDIAGLRQAVIAAAGHFGLGIVAAGTVPLADPGTLQVTADPRYEHIRGEYRMLVREQLICSTQVHVDVDDRDLAIAVGRRIAPWLPALLALSASSPFWLGTDTGYASYRTLIWRRWPTAGALPGFESAADYDRAVADLVRSGVILDRARATSSARLEMSHTTFTVPDLNEPPGRHDITIRVAKEAGRHADPAAFTAAASQAAAGRDASILSAHTAEEIICVVSVPAATGPHAVAVALAVVADALRTGDPLRPPSR